MKLSVIAHRCRLASRRLSKRLRESDRGAVAPLLGLTFIVLIGAMGFAVDVGRSMVVKARLTNALDAAGLAVGARVATANLTAEATRYVNANFKTGYAAATVTSVTATTNADNTVVTLNAVAVMPTAFMKLFNTASVTVRATTEITRQSTGLELVMVLDNTGSMEISGSMPGLKTAATSLVNTLFGSETQPDNLYIGLVPFSQAVNIGTSRAAWVQASTLLATTNPYYPTTWTGCIDSRSNAYDRTDDPPTLTTSATMFKAYYSPNSSANNWIKSFFGFPYTDIYYTGYNSQQGPGAYCPQPVTPMTNVKSKILTGITNMKAAGSTMINLGAVWGWRMLSPRWRGYWDGDMASNNLPLNYDTPKMQKAVLLMTDGENSFAGNNYTAYGYLSEGKLGFTNQSRAEGELNSRLTEVCTSMKAAGILVYTVAFDNPDTPTKTMLQGCATNSSLYFDAANTTALNAAFTAIAASLSNLRVSK